MTATRTAWPRRTTSTTRRWRQRRTSAGPATCATAPPGRPAILSYNNSSAYVALVDAYERGYRTGSFDVPTPFGP